MTDFGLHGGIVEQAKEQARLAKERADKLQEEAESERARLEADYQAFKAQMRGA